MAEDRPDYEAVMSTPVTAVKLGINTTGDKLSNIDFIVSRRHNHLPRNGFIHDVVSQLQAYFRNPHFTFTLPLTLQGTSFQKCVWQMLRDIPCGNVLSYGTVAKNLGTAPRAVGGACRANPIPIVIPCHRVVASDGLGGYSGTSQGHYIQIKQWLLTHEQG